MAATGKKGTSSRTGPASTASLIGRRLRQLRNDNDWTVAEVAQRTGISTGTLSKLEHGKAHLNSTSVNKLVNGVGLPVTAVTNPVSRLRGKGQLHPGDI